MITREKISEIAENALQGTTLFVTAIKIGAGSQIHVSIDGDEGVTIADCVKLSRAIEGTLDRDEEDFSLDVSSHGASNPLVTKRQYRRHVGRELEVTKNSGETITGKMTTCNDSLIVLEFSVRENKAIGKGKTTILKQAEIPYEEIREARIVLKF